MSRAPANHIEDEDELKALGQDAYYAMKDCGKYTHEEANAILVKALSEKVDGGTWLRERLKESGNDLYIHRNEYRIATRGADLHDSTIRFIMTGDRVKYRTIRAGLPSGMVRIIVTEAATPEPVAQRMMVAPEGSVEEERARICNAMDELFGDSFRDRALLKALRIIVRNGE